MEKGRLLHDTVVASLLVLIHATRTRSDFGATSSSKLSTVHYIIRYIFDYSTIVREDVRATSRNCCKLQAAGICRVLLDRYADYCHSGDFSTDFYSTDGKTPRDLIDFAKLQAWAILMCGGLSS